ncbi:Hybrid signal transduction histidine kinase K, partial [Lachnellula suecica]
MTESRGKRKKARGRQGEFRITSRNANASSEEDEHLQDGPLALQEIGIRELLEQDSRPTFVLDLQFETNANPNIIHWNVAYCNKALRFFDELRTVILAETYFPAPLSPTSSSTTSQDSTCGADRDFREWATSNSDFQGSRDGYLPRHTFRGMFWTSATLRCRWRAISASQVPNQRQQSHGTPRSSSSRSTSRSKGNTSEDSAGESGLAESNLSKQLADSESKFRVLTELNPVGMYYLSPEGLFTNSDGNILYANDMWYEITGHPRGLEGEMSFMNVIAESDHPLITKEWGILTSSKGKREFELRLRNPWRDEATGKTKQKWILASCDQEFDKNGDLKSIMGCITDISPLKHIEEDAVERANLVEKLASVQMNSRIQAEEAKRQQETFIDMTSHEMRNPLSAIMLCADGIANSLTEFRSQEKSSVYPQDLIESNLDAAQTIVLCAQHQKRIIDDVLTLSKLNSTMLYVSPTQVHVESTVRRTLKIFEGELQADNIQTSLVLEPSFKKAKIDWVYCDPVRLTQVFINLLTNAIKFTRSEDRREIAVNLGASTSNPPKDDGSDVQWLPSKNAKATQNLTLASEWGTGDEVFLYFGVKDTGRGLSDDEKTRLFHRFSQASPRTHVQYGGSGLGLFISRELTELQGGEIGVASVAGRGSTFAFYIKARTSTGILLEEPSGVVGGTDSLTLNSRPESLISSETPSYPARNYPHYQDYHILLVEDNLINQKVLSKQLRTAGCTVHVANHGAEALDFLSQTTLWNEKTDGPRMELSIILMDLEMPIMDGLVATRAIRDMEREGKLNRHVPIIAVTANTRTEQMDLALEAGMDDIVPKPFHIPDLMQKTE